MKSLLELIQLYSKTNLAIESEGIKLGRSMKELTGVLSTLKTLFDALDAKVRDRQGFECQEVKFVEYYKEGCKFFEEFNVPYLINDFKLTLSQIEEET